MTTTTPTRTQHDFQGDHNQRRLRVSRRVAAIRRAHRIPTQDAIFLAEGVDAALAGCAAARAGTQDPAVADVLAQLEQTVIDAMLPRATFGDAIDRLTAHYPRSDRRLTFRQWLRAVFTGRYRP